MPEPRLRRDWTEAVEAHEGRPCRVCLRWPRELAHVIPRTNDTLDASGRRRRGRIVVSPLAVIPLCREHHSAYDARRLNLLPHLKPAELENAFSLVGKTAALRYILGPNSVLDRV